jgi:acetyl-CoA acetyltransferase
VSTLPEAPFKDKTAITGIGWTSFSHDSGTTVMGLTAEAAMMAINDAGLGAQDIDGMVSFFHQRMDTVHPWQLVEALGIEKCNMQIFADAGGSWCCAAVLCATMAIHAGVCKNVLVYRSNNSYSEGRGARAGRADQVTGVGQWLQPFGQHHAAATFGHNATAHMAKFGTTTLDFAHVAVQARAHALLNTKAQMRPKGPITIEDHQNSRWIVYPYRLLDCCQQTDGAVALVVSSMERARDMRHAPVVIMSAVGGRAEPAEEWETNGVNAAPILYEGAGVTPRDLSFAELYDPFTAMCMLHMEDFGLVKKGEVAGWVREGHHALDSSCPVNTHGGLLSEAHVHVLNHVLEAVQQLRPEGVVDDLCQGAHTYDRSVCRQVKNAEIGLVCGESGGSALLLRRA